MILENIQIDRAGGRGVAVGKTSDGKTVLVRGAAPGDVVDVRVVKRHKNFFEGRVTEYRRGVDLAGVSDDDL